MQKRIFDKTTALILLILLSPLIIISLIISFIETKSFSIFSQVRGLTIKGPLFHIYKIRTVIAQPSLGQPERRSILLNPKTGKKKKTNINFLTKIPMPAGPRKIIKPTTGIKIM